MKNFFYYPSQQSKTKAILSSPHPGLVIPNSFESFLVSDSKTRNCDVDFEVHQLVQLEKLQAAGFSAVIQNLHRICVDLNRPAETAVLNWKSNSKGQKLVLNEASESERKSFIDEIYWPYYKKIEDHISHENFLVIDLHSMPSRATAYHLSKNPNQSLERPDFCISDFSESSQGNKTTQKIISSLQTQGFDARYNDPYSGGQVTKHFHEKKCQAIQIEVSRGLYMNEESQTLKQSEVRRLQKILTELLTSCLE